MPHTSLRADLGDLYSIKKEKPLKAPPNDNMILDKKTYDTGLVCDKQKQLTTLENTQFFTNRINKHEFYDIQYLLLLPVKCILSPNSMDPTFYLQ